MTQVIRHSILIVEDEPLLRFDTVDMMEDEGFNTFEAPNADAALTILEQNPQMSVVCTDIDMPGSLDGLALAQIVRQRWPHMAIVVVSGHHRPTQSALPKDGRFVPKPYVKSAIMEALRATIVKSRAI
ncbi:response regulator [Agrobacterium rosae]|uniref:Response regulator n=1 Tax=Agrobacterium rosae TaxID=1972867 RepID=A0AAW9FMF8_9HYPH|nr:response regulator [Agrobacterium rosae]MDX8305757.1 response regulator [Agrobacterium rosae]